MSADAASIPCPVCLHTGSFSTVQSLKDRLIFVSTSSIVCPICQEEVNGLDKLTIHLFSHVNVSCRKEDIKRNNYEQNQDRKAAAGKQKKSKINSKNKPPSPTQSTTMKFVKIYPKLPVVALNTMPVINNNIANNLVISTTVNSDTTDNTSKENKCNICGVQFINESILKMHNSIIHNLEDQHTEPTRYNCHLCTKHFKMRGSLMVHLRVAHYGFIQKQDIDSSTNGDKKENCNTEEEKTVKFIRNDGKQWQCDVCNKFFTTKYFLKKHKRLHTGETPYSCAQCNKTFTFQQSYHKHLLYHNDDKPHTCQYCGRAFKELSTLHNHQRIHTGEKPFACETCGKCFRQRVSYLVHRRIHTGVMPYKCTACDKSFRYKVSQRTHKCQAQPPGTVVRQSCDLVEKLKKKTRDGKGDKVRPTEEHDMKRYLEVFEVNAELVRTGAQLSLEDMESESFSIISDNVIEKICESNNVNSNSAVNQNSEKSYKNDIEELIDSIPSDKNIPSPSEILKSLCLSNEDDYLDCILKETALS